VFGALDEYRKSKCRSSQTSGPFTSANANCEIDAVDGQDCIMRHNEPIACPATRDHWGWRDGDRDGVPDLFAPGTLTFPEERGGPPGFAVTLGGRNVWDARAVMFGDVRSTNIDVVGLDRISVEVPAGASGLVPVSYLTRRGMVTGPLEETFFLVTPSPFPNVPAEPAVFAVQPSSAPPGSTVTILGVNLAAPDAVMFGSTPADLSTLVPAPGATSLTIEVPALPPGSVEVTVQTVNGSSTPFPPFTTFSPP
jgi:hypothetical protein